MNGCLRAAFLLSPRTFSSINPIECQFPEITWWKSMWMSCTNTQIRIKIAQLNVNSPAIHAFNISLYSICKHTHTHRHAPSKRNHAQAKIVATLGHAKTIVGWMSQRVARWPMLIGNIKLTFCIESLSHENLMSPVSPFTVLSSSFSLLLSAATYY